MEKTIYLNELFDLYGQLLTIKQQKYFRDYYFNNLSYGEIGDSHGISRNAIFRQLKIIEEKLNYYEATLNLFKKKEIVITISKLINDEKVKKELLNIF